MQAPSDVVKIGKETFYKQMSEKDIGQAYSLAGVSLNLCGSSRGSGNDIHFTLPRPVVSTVITYLLHMFFFTDKVKVLSITYDLVSECHGLEYGVP